MADFNTEQFEKILFKKLITSLNTMSMVSPFYEESIFKNKNFATTASIYHKFYIKNGKLPTKEEVKLYVKNNKVSDIFKSSIIEIKDLVVNDIDEDLFIKNTQVFLKERLAFNKFNDIIESLSQKELDTEYVVNEFEKICGINLSFSKGFDISNDIEKFITTIKNPESKFPTGLKCLDNSFNGGIPKNGKFLGIICAPPNTGKSILLSNLACNAIRQGKNVLLISLEMSEIVYASRIYSDLCSVGINEIPFREEKLRESMINNNFGKLIIKEFPTSSLTVSELDRYISECIKSGFKPDLIVLDYMSLLSTPDGISLYEKGQTLSQKLRGLTYKYEIPMWTAQQVTREGVAKKSSPELSDMAESMGPSHNADVIIALYQKEEDITYNKMRCKIMKSRLGKNNLSFTLNYNRDILKLEDMDETLDNVELEESSVALSLESLSIK